jgi:hypothetical protein
VSDPIDYVAAMDEVFDKLGGVDGLLEWAQESPENLETFYKLIAKRLPNEVVGDGGGPVLIQLKQL